MIFCFDFPTIKHVYRKESVVYTLLLSLSEVEINDAITGHLFLSLKAVLSQAKEFRFKKKKEKF